MVSCVFGSSIDINIEFYKSTNSSVINITMLEHFNFITWSCGRSYVSEHWSLVLESRTFTKKMSRSFSWLDNRYLSFVWHKGPAKINSVKVLIERTTIRTKYLNWFIHPIRANSSDFSFKITLKWTLIHWSIASFQLTYIQYIHLHSRNWLVITFMNDDETFYWFLKNSSYYDWLLNKMNNNSFRLH